jgi:hypothetical protein
MRTDREPQPELLRPTSQSPLPMLSKELQRLKRSLHRRIQSIRDARQGASLEAVDPIGDTLTPQYATVGCDDRMNPPAQGSAIDYGWPPRAATACRHDPDAGAACSQPA